MILLGDPAPSGVTSLLALSQSGTVGILREQEQLGSIVGKLERVHLGKPRSIGAGDEGSQIPSSRSPLP